MKYKLILLISIIALHSIAAQEQESIYLPFPDLPKEILNPEAIEKDIEIKETTDTEFIKQDSYNKNSILPDLKSPKANLPNSEIKYSKKEDNNNPGNKIPKSDSIKDSYKKNTIEENILTPEDREKFQKSMEEIRRNERSDPKAGINQYNKLLSQYSHPELRSKILISIAWNYFHREKNLECLDSLISIMEDEKLIEASEYPTAMYLAARVHDRPWQGQNKNFTVRYHEIFLKNVSAGRKNFTTSHYRNLIEKN